jgi:hypothetical protein
MWAHLHAMRSYRVSFVRCASKRRDAVARGLVLAVDDVGYLQVGCVAGSLVLIVAHSDGQVLGLVSREDASQVLKGICRLNSEAMRAAALPFEDSLLRA